MAKVYRLNVRLQITEHELIHYDRQGQQVPEPVEGGYTQDRQTSGYQNGLTVEDNLDLGACNFLGMMGILGEMHTAIRKVGDLEKSESK